MNFPDLGEFRFISKLLEGVHPLKKESPSHRSWLSAGDDCAIFDGWLVTKDLSVENTHFRLDWSCPTYRTYLRWAVGPALRCLDFA